MLKNNLITVWQAPLRWIHWLLAASVAGAWFTSGENSAVHSYLGYGGAVLVAFRLLWSRIGSGYAQLSSFVRPPAATWRYLRQVLNRTAARHVGHNPLGGWMAVAVWSCVASLAVTGWAMDTDLLWGYAWPVLVHATLAWVLAALIALHLAGVLFTSWQHRENLIGAMITGKKAGPHAGDAE